MKIYEAKTIINRRNPMLNEQTREKLSSLKLHGMHQALEEQLRQPGITELSFDERFALLVDRQCS